MVLFTLPTEEIYGIAMYSTVPAVMSPLIKGCYEWRLSLEGPCCSDRLDQTDGKLTQQHGTLDVPPTMAKKSTY
jgi:hypothetical protein|eukprot:COSAG02_NODE_974_length_15518_cov_97.334717_9_plen_74_part_00